MFLVVLTGLSTAGFAASPARPLHPNGIKIGRFPVEVRTVATTADGLPANDVASIAVVNGNIIYAGTARGVARFDGRRWKTLAAVPEPVKLIAPYRDGVLIAGANGVRLVQGDAVQPIAELPAAARGANDLRSLAGGPAILLGTRVGLFEVNASRCVPVSRLDSLLGSNKEIRQVAIAADGRTAVGAAAGLFLKRPRAAWERLDPEDGAKSWRPRDVRGVAFDPHGRLWFASPAGIGCLDGKKWSLYTAAEGLPYNDFTTAAAGEDGAAWFGTKIGAIRFDGSTWNYRQGRRWLPDDNVRAIAVSVHGDAWFATDRGVGRIERRMMTLAAKADLFEEAIDKYHRRTPYGYVLDVVMPEPGKLHDPVQHDSDNDGLWTAMYGAGECFAYGSSHDPKSKARAKAAFEALRFLSQVTQGGEHPAPKGFPARTILPTSGADPNKWDSVDRDARDHANDPLWKIISPRWPKSADGKWYWKTDTSSDELDGHFFMYALYYDLVAETEAEKQPVRQLVADVTGHLLDHDLNLIDHDGKPTRWARFGPETLNQVTWATDRGLNCLSILSYLLVADHVTGQPRFRKEFDRLVKDHGYLANLVFAKSQWGPGSGNQSDDEMAFMGYYNLLHYATQRDVRRAGNLSLRCYYATEEPECAPLFNYIFAASYGGSELGGRRLPKTCLSDGLDFLKRYPLDRFDWGFRNSHRLDIMPMSPFTGRDYGNARAQLRTGKVLPIDERYIEHWNYDPWTVDGDGSGRMLSDGASYLLPYYMGRYFGFFIEDSTPRS